MGGDYYFPPCSDSVAAGMAHVCYGHAGVAATAEGEMLTVWRAPELARGPLSPAILSLSLFLEGGGDKMEKRRKFPALKKEGRRRRVSISGCRHCCPC